MNFLRTSVLAAALSTALFTGAASAGTDTATFQVSITVENSCDIVISDMDFGLVSSLATTHDAATSGTVTCTGISPLSIAFNVGSGGGSLAARELSNGTDTILYNLYADAAFTSVLGDGTGGTATIDFSSTGGADAFDVYGQTAAAQNPKPVGTYTSDVIATVTF